MKFLIIGHYSYDVLHEQDGREHLQAGGLHQAIALLSSLCSRQDRILPVFGVHSTEYQQVVETLRQCSNVETAGIYAIDSPTHRVHYYPGADGTRVACVKEIAPPIPYDRIKKFLDVDGILVNMVSGSDLALDALDEIRMAVRGTTTKLHFDFHNLTLGIGKDHERVRRPVVEWRRWAFMIDTVQLNEEEIAGLAVDSLSEQETAGHLLTLSVKGVLVTRGVEGASLYYNEHKKILRKDFPAPATDAGPRVGGGDLFGVAFLWHYCRTGDLFAAAEGAVLTATEEMTR
jgi:sugar/nucleoside kinase (ribokinase family)